MTHPLSLLQTELHLAGGVLQTPQHRDLRMQIYRAIKTGRLVRPAPGVVADPLIAETPLGRLSIAQAWRPGGIFMGQAAAYIWWSDQVQFAKIEMVDRWESCCSGIHCRRRQLPPEYVSIRFGLRVTSPAVTVLDCLADGNRDVLHLALRTRRVTIHLLKRTLKDLPHRRANKLLAAELRRAKENPWSGGEDRFHEFLRERRFRGWKGNKRIDTPDGVFYGDVVFERERLIIEIDGFEHHSSPADLERDAERQAALLAAGYRVLRVTMRMLLAHPDRLERQIRAALSRRRPSGMSKQRD